MFVTNAVSTVLTLRLLRICRSSSSLISRYVRVGGRPGSSTTLVCPPFNLTTHSQTFPWLTQLHSLLRKLHQFHALWPQKLDLKSLLFYRLIRQLEHIITNGKILEINKLLTRKRLLCVVYSMPSLHFWGQINLPLLSFLQQRVFLLSDIHLARTISNYGAANSSKTPENAWFMSSNSLPSMRLGKILLLLLSPILPSFAGLHFSSQLSKLKRLCDLCWRRCTNVLNKAAHRKKRNNAVWQRAR